MLDQVNLNTRELAKLIETNSNSFRGHFQIESNIDIKIAIYQKPLKASSLGKPLQPKTLKHMTNTHTNEFEN